MGKSYDELMDSAIEAYHTSTGSIPGPDSKEFAEIETVVLNEVNSEANKD